MHTNLIQSELISAGLFSQEELLPLIEQAEEEGELLADYLLNKDKLSEDELLKLESKIFHLDELNPIPGELVDSDLIRKFPIQFLRQVLCVPLNDNGRLILAIGRAKQLERVEEFYFVLKDSPQVVLAKSADILRVINNVFGEAPDPEVTDVLDEAADEFGADFSADKIEDLLDDSSDAPLIKLVNMIMAQAVRA